MATDVEYNGVKLHNVLTRKFDQQAVYDASGTDLLYSTFSMSFECIVHVQSPTGGTGAFASKNSPSPVWVNVNEQFKNLGELIAAIRRKLSQPREYFAVTVGTWRLLEVAAAGAKSKWESDADNGPKPRFVNVTQIGGSLMLKIQFGIDCSLRLCESEDQDMVTVNNRWAVEEQIDERWFTTRTIRGRLRISSPRFDAQATRGLVIPLLEEGFRRERFEFRVAENGLDAEYTVTDKQVHTAAPWPAVKMEVTHTEGTGDSPMHWISEVNVRLDGPPQVSKRALFTRAMQIVKDRLNVDIFVDNADVLIEQVRLTDHIGEQNQVEVSIRMRHNPDTKRTVAGVLATVGTALKVDPYDGLPYSPKDSVQPDKAPGTAGARWGFNVQPAEGLAKREPKAALAALKCYLQDRCKGPHGIAETGPDLPG